MLVFKNCNKNFKQCKNCTYVSIGHCKTNMQIISTPRIYCTSKKSGTKGRLGVGNEGKAGGEYGWDEGLINRREK